MIIMKYDEIRNVAIPLNTALFGELSKDEM